MNKFEVIYYVEDNEIILVKRDRDKIYFYSQEFQELPYYGDYAIRYKNSFNDMFLILGEL